MMSKFAIFLLTTALCLVQSMGIAAAEVSAEKVYAAGDYQTAIRELENMRSAGTSSSELYYDLGNAYFQSGNVGAAVLNYNKALRLSPGNTDARHNLDFVREQVRLANETLTDGKNIDPTPADVGIVDYICNGIARCSSNTWAVVAVIIFLLLLGCVVIYMFCANVMLRKTGFFGSIGLLILCVVAIYCAVLSKRATLATDTCVLLSDEVTLRENASPDAKAVATPLSAGTMFKVLESTKTEDGTLWTEVYLNTDYTGWLPSSDIAIIELPEMRE